ncbi:MAG: hypothetical protein R3B09_03010 [Nannocystaceae bacterium]
MQTAPGEPLHATLMISDPGLDDDEREGIARQLFLELLDGDLEGVAVHRPTNATSGGAKSLGATILGVIGVLISANGLAAFFGYLGERSRGREIAVELERGGDKIRLTARTQEEFVLAYNAAVRLMEGERKLEGEP